jgi:nucleotide-binding universal stress UspA family protein
MNVQKIEKEEAKTILAVTDFSKTSTNAIMSAASLLKDKNLKLLLLHVFKKPDEAKTMLILVDDILGNESERGLKKQSVEITDLLKGRNLDISVYSVSGKVEKAINTIIQTQDIDLLVIGMSAGKYSFKNLVRY